MRCRPAVLALLLAAAASPQAGAIGIFEELGRLGVNNEDYRIAADTAKRLYTADEVRPGARSGWQNPETGAKGVVEILEFDGRCVVVKHLFQSGGSRSARRLDIRRCRGDDGVWRLSGQAPPGFAQTLVP